MPLELCVNSLTLLPSNMLWQALFTEHCVGFCIFFFIILTLSGLVSFQKGCYVGQELTARTYHTGVIRKRLMPVKLTQTSTKEVFYLDKDTKVATTSGKLAGKIISVYNNLALGLMRLDIIKSEEELTVALSDKKATNVTVDWPTWWNLG